MAAFIVIRVAMTRDGQSSRNRRSSVDADSPAMMYRHFQQSLFLLIDIPLGLISQNLSFSSAISAPKIFSNPLYFCRFHIDRPNSTWVLRKGRGQCFAEAAQRLAIYGLELDNHRRGAGQGKERVI